MSDLTERLRTWADLDRIEAGEVLRHDLRTAADRIEALEAENERYRKALGIIAIDPGNASPWHVAAQALDTTP